MNTLKSFTIQGFKTFPDRITLTMENGVTAVVGPNGSGKSNIGEAMRWVLGEQSARAMRCEKKMEEVIFHGTETRGALGFAEASITLCNEDGRFGSVEELGSELCITRRLNRAGESDYFINKREVRLKDVQSLLMDTGLGPGGYSIIAQGMIHRIMSEKPVDRRKVFEEASGIAKYRSAKEESQRKLVLAEQNLQRVADKLDELTPQVERLEKQAETARRFLLLRDELRGHEINLWMDSLDRLRAGKGKLGDQLREAKENYEAGKLALEALENRSAELEEALMDLGQQTDKLLRDITALTQEKAGAENEAHLMENDLGHLRRASEELMQSAEEAAQKTALLQKEQEERRKALGDCEETLAGLTAEQQALNEEIRALGEDSGALGGSVDALQAKKLLRLDSLQQARMDLAALDASGQERQSRREALQAEKEKYANAAAAAREKLGEAQTALAKAREKEAELGNIIGGYQMRERQRAAKTQEAEAAYEQLRRRRHETESRHALLADLEKQYDNNHAVQMVMNARLPGVRGTLGELIRTGDETAAAIEIALGGALQNIVTDNEETAQRAIHLLKERRGGRATFMPLTTVRGEEMSPVQGDSVIGIASRLVECDEAYRGAVRQLLGRTVVCRDLDAAVALGRRERNRFRIVTLDGQVIHSGGTMTGGSMGRRVGALSRRNELAQLAAELEHLTAQAEELKRSAGEASRLYQAAVYEREVAGEERRAAHEEALSLEAAAGNQEEWLKGFMASEEAIDAQLQSWEEAGGAQQSRRASLGLQIAADEEALAALEEALQQSAAGQTALQGKQAGLGERAALLREQYASAQATKSAIEEALQGLEARLADITGSEGSREERRRAYEAQGAALEEKIAVAAERVSALGKELENRYAARDALSGQRLEQEGRRSRLTREIRERYEQNLELDRLVSKTENQLLTNQSEEEAIVSGLWEKYEISVSEAQKLRVQGESTAKTQKRIGELGKEIRALGEVNVNAIEEFEAVGARYGHLKTQRDDAAKAKEDLDGIIGEITGEMRALFAAQFALIRERFTETFLEIFGGGEATLELDEDADILESGVEIKAQPPGKKLRSISLLSGGEQSLVAIALYFAMFKVRPAPFCVLDEIDHDLDDVNVGRFAAYLKRLSGGTQYLVVTHRRGTMEQAATLYGVTTREPGVSRVIRLALDSVERELGLKLS